MVFYHIIVLGIVLSEAKSVCKFKGSGVDCNLSLSPTTSLLRCQSKCWLKPYSIRRSMVDTNVSKITFANPFGWEIFKEVISYECEDEIMFVDRAYNNSEEQCEKSNHAKYKLMNLLDVFEIDNIKKLELSHFINVSIFTNIYPQLFTLNIHHNVFPGNISSSTIHFTNPLRKLYLTHNQLQFLPDHIFSSSYSLRKLDLSSNNLTEINRRHFQKLKNLTSLNISRNKLVCISPNTFSDLNHLRTLNLSHNDLLTLTNSKDKTDEDDSNEEVNSTSELQIHDSNFLQHLQSLRNLDLSNNIITILPNNMFKNHSSLYYMDLSHNFLRKCYRFSAENYLHILNLSHNLIQIFGRLCFKNLKNLKILNISSNLIKELKLDFGKSVEILDASHNKIATVLISGKINIRVLILFDNEITSFFSLSHLSPLLELLLLDYNKIYDTNFLKEYPYFQEVNHTVTISVTFNNISTFDTSFMKDKNIKNHDEHALNAAHGILLDISFNPINCDCEMYHMKQYIVESNRHKLLSLINSENIKCAIPEPLKNHSVQFLHDDNFTCTFKNYCPRFCTCGSRGKDRKIFVNCSGLELHEADKKPQFEVSILYFNKNNLINLSSLNEWTKLTDLWVDNNRLGTLEGWIIPPNLLFLSVRGNRLKSLSNNMIQFIPTQKDFQLFFGLNSINCDCESETFKQFLLGHGEVVKDVREITCNQKVEEKVVETPLIEMSEPELCAQQITAKYKQKVLTIFFCILLLIIIVTVGLYIRQRELIHSFLYVHCNKLFCFYPEVADLEEKLYDAFVAYSSSDKRLVMNLLNELEQNAPFFKLCIHERDWIPGEIITETIVKSVRSSRRTIIVLSESFISSPWFKVELKVAISQEQMNPIIVIMVDKSISLNELNRELRDAISKRTYLEWGERWFWEKLRYAMPHKV
ncbi:protein toll-like [Parasteatoda tepidariorum]|uniref:protein toll-like n=1 Tax=Parasteatoda tepidariorum TaxID=114398 RepID=UPI00077F90F4|nr:protein toll-like [Parasteatoda tepidariorum]